ncbi:hypothetical protein ElyMa_004267900 [Elysia marginata]|uniref:Uncharacterized protein n=1 Tax=Elysia marginata TaxID=1093978 RepID=A0AAV4GUD0_9GAST|nr:hypothetical protein ElyMa_004267900 [Elysia marginata]
MNCSLGSKCKRNNEFDKAAEDIDKLPDHACMFKAVKSLTRKKSESPKIYDVDEIQTVIDKHFKDKFRDNQINYLEPFQGDARDLNNPLTSNEVEKALARLDNNKACGEARTEYLGNSPNTALIHSPRLFVTCL